MLIMGPRRQLRWRRAGQVLPTRMGGLALGQSIDPECLGKADPARARRGSWQRCARFGHVAGFKTTVHRNGAEMAQANRNSKAPSSTWKLPTRRDGEIRIALSALASANIAGRRCIQIFPRDITERKRSEEYATQLLRRLKEELPLTSSVLQRVGEAVIAADRIGQVTMLNSELARENGESMWLSGTVRRLPRLLLETSMGSEQREFAPNR